MNYWGGETTGRGAGVTQAKDYYTVGGMNTFNYVWLSGPNGFDFEEEKEYKIVWDQFSKNMRLEV